MVRTSFVKNHYMFPLYILILLSSLGAKIGLLGPNGCGKSTFMKVLAGRDKDYEGSVIIYNILIIF